MDIDDTDEQILGEARASAQDAFNAKTSWPAMRERMRQAPMHIPLRAGTAAAGRGSLSSVQWWSVAAALIVGLGGSVWWAAARHAVSQPFKEFASAVGSRVTVTLRDGTQVTLGPTSHLWVPTDFGRGGRALQLEGEAYFAVVHDAAHPLTVLAHGVLTRDIGTEFDIRAYPDDRNVRVAVVDGIVSVGDRFSGAPILTAGDIATFTDAKLTVAHHANLAVTTAWQQGRLAFDNTPLPEVIRQVQRVYGVTVVLADSALASRTLTASFGDNETLDIILISIAHAVGAQIQHDGKRTVLTRHVLTGSAFPPILRTADRGHVRE